MNKETILEMSRKENKDEGMTVAENKGQRIGIAAFCAVFAFLRVYNFFKGDPSHAIVALFWTYMAGAAYPKYTFTKRPAYLVVTIAAGLAAALSLVSYLRATMG